MTSDATALVTEVARRGFAIAPSQYPPDVLHTLSAALDALHARFGAPPLVADDPVWLADHVEVARPGLVFYELLGLAPELAPLLFLPRLVAAVRQLLGDDMHLELVGGVMSDHTRPFTEWENHLGGIDDERWRVLGKRPRHRRVQRVVHVLFLEELCDDTGPWRVLPRAVGDPVDPPAPIHSLSWPGTETLRCPAGSVLLLEESVWHSVVPRVRPGIRRFIGAYFAASSAAPTVGRSPSLDALATGDRELDPLFRSLLTHRPRS